MRSASVVLLVLAVTACRSKGDDGAGAPVELRDAAAETAAPAPSGGVDGPAPPPSKSASPSLAGEWARSTEPYGGMRISIDEASRDRAIVTAAPAVTDERLAARAKSRPRATAKAELECQARLWKPGEALITKLKPLGGGAYEGSMLVRDWGIAGGCRHVDSHAPARLSVASDGNLLVAVKRNKTVTQRWSRVR